MLIAVFYHVHQIKRLERLIMIDTCHSRWTFTSTSKPQDWSISSGLHLHCSNEHITCSTKSNTSVRRSLRHAISHDLLTQATWFIHGRFSFWQDLICPPFATETRDQMTLQSFQCKRPWSCLHVRASLSLTSAYGPALEIPGSQCPSLLSTK